MAIYIISNNDSSITTPFTGEDEQEDAFVLACQQPYQLSIGSTSGMKYWTREMFGLIHKTVYMQKIHFPFLSLQILTHSLSFASRKLENIVWVFLLRMRIFSLFFSIAYVPTVAHRYIHTRVILHMHIEYRKLS